MAAAIAAARRARTVLRSPVRGSAGAAAAARRGNVSTTRTSATRPAQLVSPALRRRTKRRTSGAAHPSRSPSADTWIEFWVSTKVERGNRPATTCAPADEVMLSRSPLSTSVGTSGYGASGGTGGSGRSGPGQRRHAVAPSYGSEVHSAPLNGA